MKILCAYNANIDALYSLCADEIITMLNDIDDHELIYKVDNSPGIINSISDFFAGLIICMKEGIGAEWLIHDQSVFQYLKEQFLNKSILRMGGNMGIMANVLAEMGAERVIPNVITPTSRMLSFFSKNSIFVPKCDLKCDSNIDEPIHFVFDFKKGETFSFSNITFTVPRENRFIATYDIMNMSLNVNPCFKEYAINHTYDGLLISGFHMMLETYPDGSNYTDYLQQSLEQIKSWKSTRHTPIHVEFGHFTNSHMAQDIFLNLAVIASSIGMNEDELSMLQPLHNINATKVLEMDIFSVMQAAKNTLIQSKLKKIIIHTREYILSISSDQELSIVNQLEAMNFGVMCAGAFASSGHLPSRGKLNLTSSQLKESIIGSAQLQQFSNAFNVIKYGRGLGTINNGYQICILPTLLVDKPISTVGLGDTVTASIFLRELELIKR